MIMKKLDLNTKLLIANTIWFGLWFILVFFKGISPWWFLFPVIFHWTKNDVLNSSKEEGMKI